MKLIALLLATALLATAAPDVPKLKDADKIELLTAVRDFWAAQADLTQAEKAVTTKKDAAFAKRNIVQNLVDRHKVAGYVLDLDKLVYVEEKKVPPVPGK